MTPIRVARVALPVPLHRQFDYSIPDEAAMPDVGARVLVPFAGRRLVGIVTALNPEDAHEKVKPIARILDEESVFGEEVLGIGRWLASYYQHPLGEVLTTLLPSAARRPEPLQIRREERWEAAVGEAALGRAPKQRALFEHLLAAGAPVTAAALKEAGSERTHLRALAAKGLVRRAAETTARGQVVTAVGDKPVLNHEQTQVLERLEAAQGFFPALLDGITGSGKTEVYLRFMEIVLARGKQVLVLVPEIALTPQTLARFQARFGTAAVMHSNLNDQARLQVWLKARSHELPILIGTRSAVLTPFADLGLIVVDEEHDASFKQTDGLRYSARDLAVKRARDLNIPLILGSATPSFESMQNALTGRYEHLRLTERAGGASLPEFRLIDIRGHQLDGGLSETLLQAIGRTLDAGGQALVFINRRGFAPSLICASCNWQGDCPSCDWPMTMHQRPPAMICHHCGYREPLPNACPACGSTALIPVGSGTQRCEDVLTERFPEVPVYRIDRDTTRSQRRLEERLQAIGNGEPAILVGTQMLAKGHHFPDVTLVAIINADGGFMSPDFRAPERTAQLIVQVAGRAGRAERPGTVYVQTYQPESPVLGTLLREGYGAFAREELDRRAEAGLPPHLPMALLRAEAPDGEAALSWLKQLKERLGPGAEAYGPAPALMPRVADRIRQQLMVIANDRGALHRALAPLKLIEDAPRQVRWSVDVDPYDSY
ncbi:MAG: primosomal protein N' [Pseudomonadota bacterium]